MGKKVFRIISAAAFATAGLLLLISIFVYHQFRWVPGFAIVNLFRAMAYIALGVVIFMNLRNLGLLIVAGINLLMSFIWIFMVPSFYSIMTFLAFSAFCFYVFVVCLPNVIKLNASFARTLRKVLWFIPGAIYFLAAIVAWATGTSTISFFIEFFLLGAITLGGLWLANEIPAAAPAGNAGFNRAAAGAWVCPNCGHAGNVGAFCGKCGTKRPVVQPAPAPAPAAPLADGLWTCPACGRPDNKGKFCNVCGTKRPEVQPAPAPAPAPASFINADGTWTCPNCGNTGNFAKFCRACGTKRPEEAAAAAAPAWAETVQEEAAPWETPSGEAAPAADEFAVPAPEEAPVVPEAEEFIAPAGEAAPAAEELIEEAAEQAEEAVEAAPEEFTAPVEEAAEQVEEAAEQVGEAAEEAAAAAEDVTEQSSSAADEIMKFKNLMDAGIITPEEFDAKKKQLLGL